MSHGLRSAPERLEELVGVIPWHVVEERVDEVGLRDVSLEGDHLEVDPSIGAPVDRRDMNQVAARGRLPSGLAMPDALNAAHSQREQCHSCLACRTRVRLRHDRPCARARPKSNLPRVAVAVLQSVMP